MGGRACIAGASILLAGCAVGPDFERPAPPQAQNYGSAPIKGETSSAEASGSDTQRFVAGMDIPAQWWTLFRSPVLTRLVEESLKANPNIAAAQAALRQSHELYVAERTSLLPMVQSGFSATRAEYPSNSISNPTVSPTTTYNLYTAQLSLSYVPDVFGGSRRAIEAAKAEEEANRFEFEATYLTLSSNVVVTAVQEASLRGQIAATERLLSLQHQLTDIVRRQRELGTASLADLLAQQATEAQTAQALPPLEKQLGQTRDALTALMGRLPADEPQETFVLDALTLPPDLPVSLPSKLIEQRPDVRQAEENLHAATANVGVAVSAMLPQFTIDANAGSSALNFGTLFTPGNNFWSVGSSVTQTLFDAGALLHKKRAADAAMDQAAAQYRAVVIQACQNVADTLRALKSDADALKAGAAAEAAAKASYDLAERQFKLGAISFVTLLNAEQAYRQAEIAFVQVRANRLADTAGLFQALGGGWWNRIEEARNDETGLTGK